jgi:hypothetical protein
MLEEFYNAYKSNKIDMYLGMRWLVEIESEKGSWYEEYMNFENVNFTLLKYIDLSAYLIILDEQSVLIKSCGQGASFKYVTS